MFLCISKSLTSEIWEHFVSKWLRCCKIMSRTVWIIMRSESPTLIFLLLCVIKLYNSFLKAPRILFLIPTNYMYFNSQWQQNVLKWCLKLYCIFVGLSCAVYRSVQDSYCTIRDKRHMTDQQIYNLRIIWSCQCTLYSKHV